MTGHIPGQHWTAAQLMLKWGYSRSAVRRLIKDEPGVLKLRGGRGERTRYQVPEEVERRIHTRLLNPPLRVRPAA